MTNKNNPTKHEIEIMKKYLENEVLFLREIMFKDSSSTTNIAIKEEPQLAMQKHLKT